MRGQSRRECCNETPFCSHGRSKDFEVAVAAEGSSDASLRDIEDYELELIYSGGSDSDTDSKKTTAMIEPDLVKPKPTKSDLRSAMILDERRDIFGSSDESDTPSPRRSR